jgi:hypothetical protein
MPMASQSLQDKYTKAGQLDEAIAIRDYVRAEKSVKTILSKKVTAKP